jgi:hypothetical protein
MLASFAFLFFFLLCLFFIYSRTRNKVVRFEFSKVLMGFGFKVAMGCLYGYIFQKYYGGDDTWMLHDGSILEYEKLMHNPGQFFADLDPTASFRRNEGFAAGWYYLLSDMEFWTITKPMAIFNMFSRGNYYINVIFFNLITFWGQYLVYKVFAARFPSKHALIFFLTFLFPSFSFWLSGIRPDAWIMVSIGFAIYYFHAWMYDKKIPHLLLCGLGLAGLVVFRSPVLMILLPGLLAWFITEKTGRHAAAVFLTVYAVSIVLFFFSATLSPGANMLTYVVHRQQEFLQLKGNTVYHLNTLQPTAKSFIQTLPQAFVNTFLRPTLWDAKGALQWFEAISTMVIWLLMMLALLGPARQNPPWARSPLIWLCIYFGVFLYLFIGYTVPFPGAIARYKVIPELLLLLAICLGARTDSKKR